MTEKENPTQNTGESSEEVSFEGSRDDLNTQLSERIKSSARQIWLAGLGAYNKAEEDTGKLFDKLVKEGEEIETKTRSTVKKQFQVMETTVEDVKSRASGTLDKLEHVFDQRVSRTLKRLGIPTKKEMLELQKRVDVLSAKLEEMQNKKPE
ncbi:MAG: poly(hydroxyalkanoate) granule-associated protein [Proteobacteria bacterium]|nr:MAG: poly(hydroxyalkanoate) granule-associated protein [Pseudomonadota bacterium]